MKSLIWVILLWLVSACTVGWLGDTWLQQRWRQDAITNFQRDVTLAIRLLEAESWRLPLETDPRWESLEKSLALEIVPTSLATSRPTVAQPPSKVTDSIDMVLGASGRFRLSARANVQMTSPIDRQPVQFTRQLQSASFRPLWWKLWSLINACGISIAIVGIKLGQRQLEKQRFVLTPWIEAAKRPQAQELLLPPIEELESELEPSLSLIAERVNRTVAELENSNQRSDLVLGNLQEGVLAVDQNSGVLLANSSLRRLLEIQEDLVLNRPLLEVIRIPLVAQLIDQVLGQQVPREDVLEFGTPPKNLRLLAKPLPLGGQRSGALLTVRDETLLKRIESIRRDFVANASHELKTPLAAIRAYAETLQLGALDDREAAEQFVTDIIAQADRINGLVQGMLQLSRVQAGTALRIEAFDVMNAIEPCLAASEAMAKGKGVLIDLQVPQEQILIRSDRIGFQTIVSNLLSNAVRYTPERGRVTLTLDCDANWLVVVVSDTGIGIQREDLDRIFERFYRAEKGRSADTGGTGLGLAIVKNLVHALEGTVSATSTPNEGSRFEVRLPLRHRKM